MCALNTQKPLLIVVAIASAVFFSTHAQAQAICSGTGTYQSCLGKSGNSYTYKNRYGPVAQVNGTGKHWYQNSQKIGSMSFNKGVV